VIVWINGPFGVGKSTVAATLSDRWPEATVFDPEYLGFMLRNWHPPGAAVDDFQDLSVWRRLVVETASGLLRDFRRPLIVPMTLLRREYFDEIVGTLRDQGVDVRHFCLVAGRDEVVRRVRQRGDTTEWIERKYDEYGTSLGDARFAAYLDAERLGADALADAIAASIGLPEGVTWSSSS
jgi:hypothetical protein